MRIATWLRGDTREITRVSPETAIAVEAIVAAVAAFAVGLRIQLPAQLTPAVIVAALLLPVWVQRLKYWAWARTTASLLAIGLLNGFLLTSLATSRYVIDGSELRSITFLVLSIFLGAGVLLWARQIIGLVPVSVLFGIAAAFTVSRANPSVIENPWKFGYSVPVTIVVLAIAAGTRRLGPQLLALVALSGVAVLSDSRSYFAILLIAAVVVIWQRIALHLAGQSLAFSTLGLIGGASLVWFVAVRLAVGGQLGEAVAQRTQAQLQTSGSLILGGRPEFSATVALMRDRIWGYGLGRQPTMADLQVAKTGMAAGGYDPNNGYVERYMFGSGFELHSLFGDFWAHLGLGGIVLIFFVAVVTTAGLARRVRRGTAPGLVVFLGILLLWNIGFSPLYSSVAPTTMAIAALLWRTEERASQSVNTPSTPAA